MLSSLSLLFEPREANSRYARFAVIMKHDLAGLAMAHKDQREAGDIPLRRLACLCLRTLQAVLCLSVVHPTVHVLLVGSLIF